MRNLEGREITSNDDFYVSLIRRANLDSMAGMSKLTIASHRRTICANVKRCARINKTPLYEPRGPMPLSDTIGMGVMVDMLHKSVTAEGRIRPHVQFDTIRKERSTISKVYASSPKGIGEVSSFAKGAGRVRPTSCPTQSEWLQDALRGCEYRMGFESCADHGVSIEAIVQMLEYIKEDAEEDPTSDDARQLLKIGAFICMVTSASLRGHEGFFADLTGMRLHIDKGRDGVIPVKMSHKKIMTEAECNNLPHVAICLQGNFKGEGGINYHILNVANKTMSGLQTRWWIEKLLEINKDEGYFTGPAFRDDEGNLAASTDYDAVFRQYLSKVQESTDLIEDDINVDTFFSISRTPRKSANTRALRANLSKQHIDKMNRWKTVENAKGRRPRVNMQQHYSEACLLMPTTWFYAYAL